jgi:hypothetical protein
MDVGEHYFEYEASCGCGIPRIDLLGTADDWRLLRAKAENLKRLIPDPPVGKRALPPESDLLERWLKTLLPALDHFVAAAEGSPEIGFWGSVCNLTGGYGETENPVTGWVSVFFPYLQAQYKTVVPNWGLQGWEKAFQVAKRIGVEAAMAQAEDAAASEMAACSPDWFVQGVQLDEFPPGLSSAPVTAVFSDAGISLKLPFYGGLFAIHQHPDGALEVRTGWAVVEKPPAWPEEPFIP